MGVVPLPFLRLDLSLKQPHPGLMFCARLTIPCSRFACLQGRLESVGVMQGLVYIVNLARCLYGLDLHLLRLRLRKVGNAGSIQPPDCLLARA